MPATLEHIQQIMAQADILFTEAEVEAAIDRVAQQINEEFCDKKKEVFYVMNGGLIF